MAPERSYASPKAFRQALTDRLKSLAAEGPWGLPELQRQIAYDVAPFVDPLLDGSAEGSWNPAAGRWSGRIRAATVAMTTPLNDPPRHGCRTRFRRRIWPCKRRKKRTTGLEPATFGL